MSLKSALTEIGDTIRRYLGTNYKYKLEEMPAAIDDCCQASSDGGYASGYEVGLAEGHANGYTEGLDKGYTAGVAEGKQVQIDEFWAEFTQKGTRASFSYAFAYWSDEIFYPKYDLKPSGAIPNMFANCTIKNLKQRFIDCGVTLDTSAATNFSGTFAYSQTLSHIPIIDARIASNLYMTFYNDRQLVEIEKLIIPNEGTVTYDSAFTQCISLQTLIIEGTISKNGFNVQWSTKLTHDSLMSIINALKDNSGTDTWNTIILGSENIAKLTESELAIMNNKQWNYI